MIEICRNQDLTPLSTLKVPSVASHFVELNEPGQLFEIVSLAKKRELAVRVLGGGSNLIFSEEVDALVVKMSIFGKSVVSESEDFVVVRASAGEEWHSFVLWASGAGYLGLENLALIPGTVGASPIQNIGAYGVEVGSIICSVKAFDLNNGEFREFTAEECLFGYRDSIFKLHENRYVIVSVDYRLSKIFAPVLTYGPLKALSELEDLEPSQLITDVVSIREQKLPDPESYPNCGSFFKNPIVTSVEHDKLLALFPNLVSFPYGDQFKLAAGWLIDQAGYKGRYNEKGIGCFESQALVLVNLREADATQVLMWAKEVSRSVGQKFGVQLEIEPRKW